MMNKNEAEALIAKADQAVIHLDEAALCNDLTTDLYHLAVSCNIPVDAITELLDEILDAVMIDQPLIARDSFLLLTAMIRDSYPDAEF